MKGFSLQVVQQHVTIEAHYSELEYDNVIVVEDDVEIYLEGMILNLKNLLKANVCRDKKELLYKLYKEKLHFFIQELEGEFRGIIYNKIEGKITVFTNPTATQRVFFKHDDGLFMADSSLLRLVETAKKKSISIHPNLHAIYELICFQYVLEDKTPVEHFYRVLDGEEVTYVLSSGKIEKKQYFDLKNITEFNASAKKGIDYLHEIFSSAVSLEYQKKEEWNCKGITNLSGGLDSRVAMLYAIKNKQKIDEVFCFSQSDYWDHTISKKIAEDFSLPYTFVPLENFGFLQNIDHLAGISEGLSLYSGGIHVDFAYGKIKKTNKKIVHTGQIGGGILGTYNKVKKVRMAQTENFLSNKQCFHHIENPTHDLLKNYPDEVLFFLKNSGFNSTILGSLAIGHFAYQASPFMQKEFMQHVLSLPKEWRYHSKIYIDWILKHCKDATKYTWERSRMKPNAKWKVPFGYHFVRRAEITINHKLGKGYHTDMAPYQYYYDRLPVLKIFYENYFQENLYRVEKFPDLQQELVQIFKSPSFINKIISIHILSVFKLFFEE